MAELSLPACPICEAPDSLFRQQREVGGRAYTWYECQACGSVLLWAGDGQWIYQKVEREDKAYLLKQPLTVDDLEALLASGREVPEQEAPPAPAGWEVAEEERPAAPVGWDVADVPTLPVSREEPEDDLLIPQAGWEVAEGGLAAAPPSRDVEEAGGPAAPAGWDEDLLLTPAQWDLAEESPAAQADVPTVTLEQDVSAADVHTVTVSRDEGGEPSKAEGLRSPPPKLFVWLVGLCLIVFLVLVAIVVYQVVVSAGLF